MTLPIPTQRALRKLGTDIKDARRRRRISTVLMTQRADISRPTLYKIEKGNSGVSLGAYASVLFVLGLTSRLADLAEANFDDIGRRLEEENLPKRIRYKKIKIED